MAASGHDPLSTEERPFTCSICNAECGLVAHVRGNRVTRITPDHAHPLSRGYCCPKGLALAAVANDPDRVRQPLKRIGSDFVPVPWRQALREIADRLQGTITKDSPRAVAYYYGTNSVHSYHHSMWVKGFMDAVGSPNVYNAGSVDDNNLFVAHALLYGSSAIMPVPDLARADFLLLLGTNPAVTNLSLVTCANVMRVFRGILARRGAITLLDPRRNDTARVLAQHPSFRHYFIAPGTDIFLLLAMLHAIFAERLEDVAFLSAHCRPPDVGALRSAVAGFTPERVARVCQVPAEVIRTLARQFAQTPRAAIYGRLGTSLSPFNTLNAWAIGALHVVAGKLDRPGGLVFGKNVLSISRLGKIVGMGAFDTTRSRVGHYPAVMGAFPLGTLAREILAPHHPVRALFISGGNPLLTAPNSGEFQRAIKQLELCVVLDFYINETALAAADYILPVTTPLERATLPMYHLNYQVFPHVDYHDPIVLPPPGGPVDEWIILGSLMRLLRVPFFGKVILNLLDRVLRAVNRKGITPETFVKFFLLLGQVLEKRVPRLSTGAITFRQLKRRHFIGLGPHACGVLAGVLQTGDKKVHLFDPRLQDLLVTCRQRFETCEIIPKTKPASPLVLVGGRTLPLFNSWLHNVNAKETPRLWVHPADAQPLGIRDGDAVTVSNELGCIDIPARVTKDIMPGVVHYPHGWGHHNPHLSRAARVPGANVNVLTDSRSLDPLSGIPIFNGVPVTLRKRSLRVNTDPK